ncbi:MAG: hypothetical protein E7667_03980 [Ruminococcaceae bacterium]|nr:hypothetical protein [Oscillospiraceae bacterium]
MKKFTKILCLIFAIVMVASCMVAVTSASSAYQTYTYSISGYPLLSPDAYTPDTTIDSEYMGLEVPIEGASDLLTDKNNNVYIADTKNNRIVCLDRYFKLRFTIDTFRNDNGVNDALTAPQGVFVTDENIWVCDTGASRIVVFDLEGNFVRQIGAPDSTLFETGAIYQPVALAVDQYDRIFVVSSTTQEGIIVMTGEGEFTGFIGAQAVTAGGVWEAIWKKFQTEEQKATETQKVASEFNNISIDSNGFIYVTTSTIEDASVAGAIEGKATDGTYMPVKMLNTNGDEIMRRNGFWPPAGEINYAKVGYDDEAIVGVSTIVDVAIGPEGTWSIIDQKRSKIYTYDDNGSLLFAFGDIGNMMGNIMKGGLAAITYQGSKMLVLDKQASKIVVYKRTEYGDILINALEAENNQEYDLAINYWTQILQRNSNFDAAYVGIGQAMYRNGEYEESLEQFEAAYDTENWSKSYKEIRKQWMSEYFILLIIIIVAVIAGFLFFFKFVNKVNKKATHSGKKKTFGEELAYGFHLIFHPFDGFWDLKHEKRGSVRAALVYLVITVLTFYYQSIGSGYLSNPQGLYSSIFVQVLSVLLPLALFVIANWCLTTLFEGEGSLKDIFIASCYSLVPLPLLMIPATVFANFATLEELDIVTMLYTIALVWVGLLLFFGTMITHDYTMGKNIITIAGTLVGMVFIIFIALLFSTLVTKMVDLVKNIITEIQFRV